ASLNAELVDISDPGAVEKLRESVSKHDEAGEEAVFKAFDMAAGLGLPRGEFTKLLLGETAEPGYKKEQGFANLAYFLKKHIEDLQDEAKRFRQEKDGYELTVIALHKQAGGMTSRIHVDEYDNIPGGDPEAPRPLERYGIRMTPKELRRFRMEVKASQKAADTIREIMDNRDEIRSGVKQLGTQLEVKLEQTLKQMLKQFVPEDLELESWQAGLASSIEKLAELEKASGTPDRVKTASGNLLETLKAVQDDLTTAAEIVTLIKQVQDRLTNGQTADLFELVVGVDGVLTTLNDLADKVETLAAAANDWPKRIETINENVLIVGGEIVNKKTVLDEIKPYLAKLPKTTDFVSFINEYMSLTDQMVKAADTLEDVSDPIYHDIKDPPTARIDLGMYRHLERKDGIIVKVVFRAKGSGGSNEVEHMESYYLELEKLDVHTSVTASLIFARASSGTDQAKEWSPNVAAMVNWHYRIREPEGTGDELWNWLDPAAGVHLASLNQGDDTVEFGIGPSLSFWNGLLNAGYGYNLSLPEDREYFFVGLNLLHLLDVARGTASTPSWQREIDYK
ncbi:MAG: hypothetical protein ACYS7Y_18005, partial [Planctomycetota bacterium]